MDDEWIESIKGRAAQIQQIAKQAIPPLQMEVDTLIAAREEDSMQIERLLDLLLDVAFIPDGLAEFKKLCRYYFTINPVVTADLKQEKKSLMQQLLTGKRRVKIEQRELKAECA